MARLPGYQEMPENIAHIPCLADLDQMAAEVRPADESAIRKGFRMLVGIVDTFPGKPPPYLLGTPLAKFHDPDQSLLELAVPGIDPEADKVDCLAIPGYRELDSRHQPERLIISCRLQRTGDARGRIMVRQREDLDPGRGCMAHEFCGCQGAVGGCRMRVKIVNEAHKAPF
jgi:hypothetical protein